MFVEQRPRFTVPRFFASGLGYWGVGGFGFWVSTNEGYVRFPALQLDYSLGFEG